MTGPQPCQVVCLRSFNLCQHVSWHIPNAVSSFFDFDVLAIHFQNLASYHTPTGSELDCVAYCDCADRLHSNELSLKLDCFDHLAQLVVCVAVADCLDCSLNTHCCLPSCVVAYLYNIQSVQFGVNH